MFNSGLGLLRLPIPRKQPLDPLQLAAPEPPRLVELLALVDHVIEFAPLRVGSNNFKPLLRHRPRHLQRLVPSEVQQINGVRLAKTKRRFWNFIQSKAHHGKWSMNPFVFPLLMSSSNISQPILIPIHQQTRHNPVRAVEAEVFWFEVLPSLK